MRQSRQSPPQAACAVVFAALSLVAAAFVGYAPARAQAPSAQTKTPAAKPAQTPAPKPPVAAPSTADDGDDEIERVDTNLVDVVFNATDRERRFVTTLQQADVQVFENNVAQSISLFQRETDLPLALVFLVDTSESQRAVLSDEKRAALAFIEAVLRPGKDEAAIVSFTGESTLEQELTNDLEKLRTGVNGVEVRISPENQARIEADEPPLPVEQDPSGYTGVWDAVWSSVNEAFAQSPPRARRAIILLSDGDDTSSVTKRQEALDLAVKANVVLYAVGIRDEKFGYGKLQTGTLLKSTKATGGSAFFPHNEAELRGAFKQIEQELRTQYLVSYSPLNKRRDGSFRRVRLDLVNPQLRKQKIALSYREGYYANPPAAAAGASVPRGPLTSRRPHP